MHKEHLLQNIFWSFIGEKFSTLEAFDNELKEYADYMERSIMSVIKLALRKGKLRSFMKISQEKMTTTI